MPENHNDHLKNEMQSGEIGVVAYGLLSRSALRRHGMPLQPR